MAQAKKKELRAELRTVLSNLDTRWEQAASRELCKHISNFLAQESAREYEVILAWFKFFAGEVDLAPLIDEQLDKRQVYLPRTRPNSVMDFISISKGWLGNMAATGAGIPEPDAQHGQAYNADLANRTVVLVPGLAFGKDGSRLGRGKGYYDNFLSRAKMVGVLKIGICWSLQLLNSVPTDAHDVYMDYICTEEGFIKISN